MKFKIKDTKKLIAFLQTFTSVNQNVVLELNTAEDILYAKCGSQDRVLLKYSKICFSDVFDTNGVTMQDIKFGILNLKKLIDSFKQFPSTKDTYFEIVTAELEDEMVGTQIVITNEDLDINFQCPTLKLFTYISDQKLQMALDATGAAIAFEMSKEQLDRIGSLLGVDDDVFVSLIAKGGNITVKCTGFNQKISTCDKGVNVSMKIKKDAFNMVDAYNTMVSLCQDSGKVIFQSTENDTIAIVGEAK